MSDVEPAPPARHEDAAIFACDAAHLPFAWVAARQIDRSEPERRFDIVIASPDIARIPRHLDDGRIRFVRLDVSAIPAITHPNPRISLGTFYRHLLPPLFRNDYRALLYMDTDTWLRRPGIGGLFARIAGDWPLAAVLAFLHVPGLRTRQSGRSRRDTRRVLADLGSSDGRYFQSGVLLIQTGPHLAEDITARVLGFASEREDLLHRHKLGDQAALNGAVADRIRTLDPRWNWHSTRWRRADLLDRFDPWILHFAGGEKPWLITDDPEVTRVNAAWFADLALYDPGFRPRAMRGSLAWRRANPPGGPGLLGALRLGLRRRWLALRHARPPRMGPRGMAEMQRLIDSAEVG
ncbi:glycosyltransferase family 8 protein [Paracoccus pacificus]|uniref:Glycosyltransferase family 8 protein n=1 Tax=Paracoccus pacificus TaxID=1463598 RepID=A0ABW4R2G0_9RHOB